MGFWEIITDLFGKVNNMAEEKMDNFNDNYDKYSEKYSNMSDEELKRECNHLRNQTGGEAFAKAGRREAMKEEIEKRRG